MGNLRIAGEEGQVRVDLRRDRMIVAGAEMAIGPELAFLAAHHHRHLGMRLQFDEAEHHLHAGAFEVARPADIGLFVEARLQLDQRRHRLSGFGRVDQRAHDRAVVRGPVERLLYRQNVRIARSLEQKLDHHVEALVGVVDDHVLFADGGKAVSGVFADAFGKSRIVRLEAQIVARRLGDLGQRIERQKAGQHGDAVFRNAEFADDEMAQLQRHFRIDLDADHRTTPAALQRGLDRSARDLRPLPRLRYRCRG